MKSAPELVDVTYPAKRCYAPGCGDKIKDKKMWRTEDEYVVLIKYNIQAGLFGATRAEPI